MQLLILGSLAITFLAAKVKCESNVTADLLPIDPIPPIHPFHCPPSTIFCGFETCCQKSTEVCGDADNFLCCPKSSPYGISGICCPNKNDNNCAGNCCSGTCSGGVCCPLGQVLSNGVCCPVGQICCPAGKHLVSGICCGAGQIVCNGVCCSGKCVFGPILDKRDGEERVPVQVRKREPICLDPPCGPPPKGWHCQPS